MTESLANLKIFKRTDGTAHEAEETQPKGNICSGLSLLFF